MARIVLAFLVPLLIGLVPVSSAADHEEELRYLIDMDPTQEEGSWHSGTVLINGESYPSSLYNDSPTASGTDISFDLSRDWQFFRATIGLRDNSSAEDSVHFQVFKDDVQVLAQTLKLAESFVVDLDVTNALRLKLRITDNEPNSGSAGNAAWGSARLIRPKAHEHERNVNLSVRKRRAKGSVVVSDGFSGCAAGVPIEIEHFDGVSWKSKGSVTTNAEGRFKFRTPRSGSVKATAPRLQMGEPWPSDVCDKDASRRRPVK